MVRSLASFFSPQISLFATSESPFASFSRISCTLLLSGVSSLYVQGILTVHLSHSASQSSVTWCLALLVFSISVSALFSPDVCVPSQTPILHLIRPLVGPPMATSGFKARGGTIGATKALKAGKPTFEP